MSKYYKTIRSECPYCALSVAQWGYPLLIVSQYLDITYYSDPACFSTFYCSAIHCPYSNLKFLMFSYTCITSISQLQVYILVRTGQQSFYAI